MRKIKIATVVIFVILGLLYIRSVYPATTAKAAGAPGVTVKKVTLYKDYKNYQIKLINRSRNAVITYKSSDKKVAVVTGKGLIKAISAGTATITVSIKQNKKNYISKIKVKVKDPYIAITKSIDTLSIGSGYTFEGKIVGSHNKDLEWFSSNDTIASIDKITGTILAKRIGSITVTAKNPISKKEIMLNVIEPSDSKGILSSATDRRLKIINSKTEVEVKGTSYYVSNSGNDLNNGLSNESAWRSLEKVNSFSLKSGDAVFFRRGDLWRGVLTAKKGVTYSAYGEGDKPKLYGSPEDGANPDNWSLLEGTNNIWVYSKAMTDCGGLVFNHGERWANKEIPSFTNGIFVIRDSLDNQVFDVKKELDKDLEFFSEANSYLTEGVPYKMGMERTTDVLGKLYLRCDMGNPGEVFSSIEFLTRGYIITPADYTIFDNLCLKYCGTHAIFARDKMYTVQNCEIGWIGGGIQYYRKDNGKVVRFGNAVEGCGSYDYFIVKSCYIYQIYDAALTNQETDLDNLYSSYSNNTIYVDNLIEYSTYGVEIFINSHNDDPMDHLMDKILVKNNIILYSGYGWGDQRYNKDTTTSIQLWDGTYPVEDLVILNNVLYLSTGHLIRCGNVGKWLPLLSGNIYAQNENGLFSRWKSNGNLKDYRCSDPNLEKIVKFVMGDKSPTIVKLK